MLRIDEKRGRPPSNTFLRYIYDISTKINKLKKNNIEVFFIDLNTYAEFPKTTGINKLVLIKYPSGNVFGIGLKSETDLYNNFNEEQSVELKAYLFYDNESNTFYGIVRNNPDYIQTEEEYRNDIIRSFTKGGINTDGNKILIEWATMFDVNNEFVPSKFIKAFSKKDIVNALKKNGLYIITTDSSTVSGFFQNTLKLIKISKDYIDRINVMYNANTKKDSAGWIKSHIETNYLDKIYKHISPEFNYIVKYSTTFSSENFNITTTMFLETTEIDNINKFSKIYDSYMKSIFNNKNIIEPIKIFGNVYRKNRIEFIKEEEWDITLLRVEDKKEKKERIMIHIFDTAETITYKDPVSFFNHHLFNKIIDIHQNILKYKKYIDKDFKRFFEESEVLKELKDILERNQDKKHYAKNVLDIIGSVSHHFTRELMKKVC